MKYFISVVLPVFNRPNSILNSLNSIKSQNKIKEFEIIIIDDSNDETPEIIGKYIESNKFIEIKYIRPKIRAGLSKSRNMGISVARGEIILFLDSDDTLVKNAFVNVINAFKKNEELVLYFGSSLYKSGKTKHFKKDNLPQSGFYKDYLKSLNQPEMLSAFKNTKNKKDPYIYFEKFSGFESLLYMKILRRGGSFYRDPDLIRVYDDQGIDRLCISNPIDFINMRNGYFMMIKKFGFDLLKYNLKEFLIILFKMIIYNRLIVRKFFSLSQFISLITLPIPKYIIKKAINTYRN